MIGIGIFLYKECNDQIWMIYFQESFNQIFVFQSDRTTIHKNLCACLLIGEIVFLAGVHQTDKPVVCGIVAGLLHFFFLAAFAWMLLEGMYEPYFFWVNS